MKVLFLNAYFYPEVISFTHLEKDLIEEIVRAGHEIFVVCPTPTRGIPTEVVEKYRKITYEDLYGNRVHVRRFWAPQEGKNPIIRAFRYFWCNLREYQIAKKYKGTDLIFAVSTPPTQGLLAGLLAKKLRCPFIYSLQDVFPDSLVTTGLTRKGSLLWKIGCAVERKTYSLSKKIVVISRDMEHNLLRKGVPEEKLVYISNWIDTETVRPVAREKNRLFEEFGVDRDKFTVVYAGNFGAAQGADIVIKTAELLRDDEGTQFVIFGGGSGYEAAKGKVRSEGLTNISLFPFLPQNRVPEVYSLGDVTLITCKPGVGNSGMPSKTWSMMACNARIIASFDTDSELAEVIRAAEAGVCVEPGSPVRLAEAIRAARRGTAACCGGRAYVEKYAARNVCVQKYLAVLEDQ